MRICLPLLAVAVTATAALGQVNTNNLTHRYSFTSNANDSVGTANGVLHGGATVANGTLNLTGVSGTYLSLPANLVSNYSSITIEAWVTDNGSGGWARIFDFGASTTNNFFLTLPSGTGTLRGAYTTNGSGAEQRLEWTGNRPPVGQEAQVVWTSDSTTHTGRLYVNGVQVASNTGMTLTPASIGATPNDWLGRSQYSADPYFNGSIDEFRIYNAVLSSNNIYQDYLQMLPPPPPPLAVQTSVQGSNVVASFPSIPNEWYWLQSSDSLNPPNWTNVPPGPSRAVGTNMSLAHVGGAGASQRYYRVQQMDPLFKLTLGSGAITSLMRTGDAFITQYLSGRLGDAIIRYRQSSTNWTTARTSSLSGIASAAYTNSPDGSQYIATYQITSGLAGGPLVLTSVWTLHQDNNLQWDLRFTNNSSLSVEIGDLALPFNMNTVFSNPSNSVFKHPYIEGYGSFIFWMRPNSVGPYLLMTPYTNTKLEYWDKLSGTGLGDGYEAFIYSKAAGAIDATANPSVTTGGQRWRQPNTSLVLAPGGSQSHGFKFQWANDYDGVRQALVNESNIDVHVVPGMTLPTNLTAQIALRTTQTISNITAEFPLATQIIALGPTNVGTNGTYQLYQVQFSQLGENKLTIQYGSNLTTYLEFFITEPVETLIKKRANFLVTRQQINDPSKWYNSLYADINMNDGVTVTPDNHDTLGNSFQVYEIASDDAGESRPAFMAEKEAVYPVQSEVTSLDNYIQNFVWGGLQRTSNESSAYAIYGVPDWHTFRTNGTTSFGRDYDYPHIIDMYYGMYKVAKYHPEITTLQTANEYLTRAYGTAVAMWTFGGGQATQVGLMNELVISDLLDDLHAAGMTSQEANLRSLWETKVAYYVNGSANLFGSEYSFDSTGFESQQAYAKYALRHAGSNTKMGSTNVNAFRQTVSNYMTTEITANVFDRGWLETAYYFYGSDYRGNGADDYIVTYMAQEGGWGLLDYAFYCATNYTDYLRLGTASYLNGWSTMNTGTPASGYGFWYPGVQYDGGCGGGFEPAPYNSTWLGGQPMHRGAWYYSAEQNLGFCGAMRMAATALTDDPIFGRTALLGTWQQVNNTNQVIPLDGVRRRFHAMLNTSKLHLVLDNDRFAADQPIVCTDDQSFTGFQVESEVTSNHNATLHLTVSVSGTYTVSNNHGLVATPSLVAGQEAVITLPIDANATSQPFTITR